MYAEIRVEETCQPSTRKTPHNYKGGEKLKVVVVVALGVESKEEFVSITKKPIKELFVGKNLSVKVSEKHDLTLIVRKKVSIGKSTEGKECFKQEVLAIFKNWEYYRITE